MCACGLLAHPYMTLSKKRWEVEVTGESPLGDAHPCAPGNPTILKGSDHASRGNSTGSVLQKSLYKLSETQPFLDRRDHIVFFFNLQLDYLFEMVSNMPVSRLGVK